MSSHIFVDEPKESDPRKRAIAAAIFGAGVTATVYDAVCRFRNELDARAACLGGVVADVARQTDVPFERGACRGVTSMFRTSGAGRSQAAEMRGVGCGRGGRGCIRLTGGSAAWQFADGILPCLRG